MRRIRAVASLVATTHNHWVNSVKPNPVRSTRSPSLHLLPQRSPFCSRPPRNDEESQSEGDDVAEEFDPALTRDVEAAVRILVTRQPRPEMRRELEKFPAKFSPEMVVEVLNRVRNDWEAAYTFFLWAAKQPNYSHSVRAYHNIIAVLAKTRKFDTAWAVISDMSRRFLVTPKTLAIMIRRYSAARDVGSAIATFHAHKRFGLIAGMAEFHTLLSALCRYDSVRDAEHLLICNEKTFPFNTKSFNIVLNGWGDNMREARRVWSDMKRHGVPYDEISYSTLISCNSRRGNLDMVLRIFERMKKRGIAPNRKVYNAVVFALAKGGFVDKAVDLMAGMEEKGISPDTVTYNSLINPLCRAGKMEEAGKAFEEMQRRGLAPTFRTYHAFLQAVGSAEEVFALLDKMRGSPHVDTYAMLVRKFCEWGQFGNAFKVWDRMMESGLRPDRSAYTALIHGLFMGGKLEEAHGYYLEMKEKEYVPEKKTEEMIKAWFAGKKQGQ